MKTTRTFFGCFWQFIRASWRFVDFLYLQDFFFSCSFLKFLYFSTIGYPLLISIGYMDYVAS